MTQIPAQAFGEVQPNDLLLGSILKFRDCWSMLVGYEEDQRDLLMLTGQYQGHLFKVPEGNRKYLAIISPFTWYPAIDVGIEPSNVDHRTTTLMLTAKGPVIVGAAVIRNDPEYRAFRMDGKIDREFEAEGSALRFVQWSAQLALNEAPYKSLGQLFEVAGPQ